MADPLALIGPIEAVCPLDQRALARYLFRGMALCRAGRHEAAYRDLTEAQGYERGSESHAIGWLFLAMASHRLGKPAEARSWLARADRWAAGKFGPGRTGGKDVEFQVSFPFPPVRKEAAALLGVK